MSQEQIFDRVVAHTRETALLESTQAALEWDERTGLPAEAGEYRAQQVTLLSGMIHARRTDSKLGEWLQQLAQSRLADDPNSDHGATIRCMLRDYRRNTKLPAKLVQAISRATVLGQQAWAIARPRNDYVGFTPNLREILDLRREEASLLREGDQTLYDALLDHYEEQASSEQIRKVFVSLRMKLVQLIQQLQGSKHRPDGKLVERRFPVEAQRRFSRWAAERIGFNFSRGRLDETDHPFCTTLGPDDHRILTRYQEPLLSSGLFGTLHEAGHGMYEQGLRRDWFGLPPGTAASLGIHESQSRLWENMVGRSRAFWQWCLPEAKRFFKGVFDDCSVDAFYRDINRVQPSLIRVEADEATYNLHILIRFELEQELLAETLSVKDLPIAWNERYEKYLGVRPPSDADGVLQDIHWSAGLVGYFPTYTLGNIYGAQLMLAAHSALGDLESLLSNGEFEPLLKWLREHVHRYGRCYKPTELVQLATGQNLSEQPLVDYLTSKLTEVYKV